MKVRAIAVVALTLLLAGTARADEPAQRASLKGLTAVRIVIDDPGKDVEAYGLTRLALRADIESRLKKAGIQILGPQERAQGMPYLYLSLAAFPADGPGDELFVYSIDLGLYQEVRLTRAPSVRIDAATWKTSGTIGTIKADQLVTLRELVGRYVDGFLAAHQSAQAR